MFVICAIQLGISKHLKDERNEVNKKTLFLICKKDEIMQKLYYFFHFCFVFFTFLRTESTESKQRKINIASSEILKKSTVEFYADEKKN